MAVTAFEQMIPRTRLTADGCMEWMRSRSSAGYGNLRVSGKVRYAHRVAYEFSRGPIPDGAVIDHLCRNRACINPWHLEATSQANNVRRGNSGGSRRDDGTFVCKKCGGTQARERRVAGAHGGISLRCIPCAIESNRKHRQKNRDALNEAQRLRRAAKKGINND